MRRASSFGAQQEAHTITSNSEGHKRIPETENNPLLLTSRPRMANNQQKRIFLLQNFLIEDGRMGRGISTCSLSMAKWIGML